ncbi:MAG: class I SAM-dependent methyltransferase [Burkholderiales bacterium]
MARTLDQIHREKTGKISDKWASYLPYYDRLFSEMRNSPITFLEIGVQNGGSLETWATYFANAIGIVGCDIDPRCGHLEFDDSRIKVVVGDANEAATLTRINELAKSFDIIVDDGSHRSHDIINCFLGFFRSLKPGGLYIVEDAHALYWPGWGGGIRNKYSAYHFFKNLIDVLSFEFWRNDLSLASHFAAFFPDGRLPTVIANGWVDAIEFRNSVIAVRKATVAGHSKLGERLTCGGIGLPPAS